MAATCAPAPGLDVSQPAGKRFAWSPAWKALALTLGLRIFYSAVAAAFSPFLRLDAKLIHTNADGNDDWRDAMRFVTHEVAPDKPVLFVGPFAEATSFGDMERTDQKDILFAPEQVYGQPGRTIHLPHVFNGEAPELDSIVQRLSNSREFYFLADETDERYLVWISAHMGKRCHCELVPKNFGHVWIDKVTCSN